MKIRRRLIILATAVAGLVLLGAISWYGLGKKGPPPMPAPKAPAAPRWVPLAELAEELTEDLHAKYGWPASFELPLQIVYDDLPEVLEKIKGPTPPIEPDRKKAPVTNGTADQVLRRR